MTQRTEVPESATLSQVGQSDIYAMSFRELDAFVDAGVRRIALRQADIIKARRALRPAILRVHDALSCRGRRTDLLVDRDTGAEYRYEGGGKLVLTKAPPKAGRKKPCGTARAEHKKAAAAGRRV